MIYMEMIIFSRDSNLTTPNALWGQGSKSLPLSEFSIFGHFWVQEVSIYGKDLKEIIF